MTDGESTPGTTYGDRRVDSPVVCVLTRFGLDHPRSILPMYREFGRVVRDVRRTETPGLLRASFLVESPRACYSLSIWDSEESIPVFGANVESHVQAARRGFRRLRVDPDRSVQLWSTKWRLHSVSNNLGWEDFHLERYLSPGIG